MILLGLGSNLGDRLANLKQAVKLLGSGPDAPLDIIHLSPVYESAALLPDGAPDEWDISFYNMCLSANSHVTPEVLLERIKATEEALGRVDVGRWGPRVIDIDILAFDDVVQDENALTIPHAEMHKRDFVMRPLADICPDWVHPTLNKTAQAIVVESGFENGDGLKLLKEGL